MKNQFNSTVHELIAEGDESYSCDVDTSISITLPPDADMDYHTISNALVVFDIEFEHRSWGIKSIDVQIRRIHPITVEIEDSSGKIVKSLQIQVDPTQLQVNKEPPTNHISVDELEIVANMEGVVDYTRSSIKTFGF